ncbi:MAG: YcgL domain-containing protein [Gammaproteobacteria bacterium]|nr:YcgL domain-containing protein [Gammaproteobacteria bacterium]
MECVVYRSARKADTYLFVECAGGFSKVPAELLQHLGRLERVMDLDLAARPKLARTDSATVERHLVEDGYYLQLPPPVE